MWLPGRLGCDDPQLLALAEGMANTAYGQYLAALPSNGSPR